MLRVIAPYGAVLYFALRKVLMKKTAPETLESEFTEQTDCTECTDNMDKR